MLTVARIDQNRIRVNVIPTRKREEDENAALCTPFSFSGTPEEVDSAMARNLWVYVEENLRLQHTLVCLKCGTAIAYSVEDFEYVTASYLRRKRREAARA